MVFSILKKDIKRKKTMNVILLLFVILAAMFVASSVNNIITVMNGTEYYFDQAGLGDYVFLTMGEGAIGKADEFLETEPAVKGYRLEDVIFASQENIKKEDGQKLVLKNTALIQSLEDTQLNFFDENNQLLTETAPGTVYLTRNAMVANNIQVGDKIRIQHSDVDIELEVVGSAKDAFLGSSLMGNSRFLLSREDYKKFESDPMLYNFYGGQIGYIDTDDAAALKQALSEVEGIAFNGDRQLLKTCYVMDMVIAGVLMVLSFCLIVVAFVVLKFTITFTLAEEFREIGVMKAIGIKDNRIRLIYIIKYMAISIVGATIGFLGSIPFGNILMETISKNMVLGNDGGILINLISTIFVVVIIVGYAYYCTKKLKKYSPLDAIRSGQTGERYKKKNKLRIGKSKTSTTTYLALNDVLSSPKRYMTIILAFSICSLLVFMVVNTVETMKSDKLTYTFAKESDVFFTNVTVAMESMQGQDKTAMMDCLDNLEEKLKKNGLDAKVSVDVQFKFPAEFDGKSFKLSCQQGFRTKTTDYRYYEGEAPMNAHEIAITDTVKRNTGARIGDTIKLTINGKTNDYLVVGYFETMNNLGDLVRIHEDVQTSLSESSSVMAFQIDFLDNPGNKEIEQRVEQIKDIFEADEVFTAAEYCQDCIGVVDTMNALGYLLLAITLIVVILVTILTERSFISEEKGEIAILKAIGFNDGKIVSWHLKRFIFVSVTAILIAIALSVPMTQLCITPIFRMMGMRQISYVINPVLVFGVYPGIILVIMVISTSLTALYTKTVKSSDTASIE